MHLFMKRSLHLMVLSIIVGAIGFADSGCHRATGGAAALRSAVTTYRLANGMTWLLVQRGEAPVFTGVVQVRVGGIEEEAGKGGLAHMFEHMAFKGSATIGTKNFPEEAALMSKMRSVDEQWRTARAEHRDADAVAFVAQRTALVKQASQYVVSNQLWQIFHDSGVAELNAFTTKDVTAYFARMPSEALPLWIYLNAHMVGHPVLREFYSERDVVMEERRTSVDNSPQGKLYEAMLQKAYTTSPYRIMPIGAMDELQDLTMADAEAFHAKYYHPERMVGVLVGRFDPVLAKEIIDKHFGSLPAGANVATTLPAEEPPQTAERRVDVAFDAGERFHVAYHKPTLPHKADYVFDAIQYILCGGESARLVRLLEQEKGIARDVACYTSSPGARLSNLFVISGQPLAGHTSEEVIAVIESELTRLRMQPVSAEELTTTRTNLEADFLWGLSTNESLAQQLAYFQSVAGDWHYLVNHSTEMDRITPDDVREVARTYLSPPQRTIAILRRSR